MSDAENSQVKKSVAITIDYQKTFNTDHGLRVLRHLMRRHGMMSTSFSLDSTEATAFNEGQRAVVIEILKRLKIDTRKLLAEINKEPQGESDVIL